MQIFLKEYSSKSLGGNAVSNAFHSKSRSKGYISALISIKSKSDLDASNVVRFIWNAILDEFNYHEGDILSSLKSAIAIADDKLIQLIKNDKESEDAGVEFDLALVVHHESTLFFGIYEKQGIKIFHEGEVVNITNILLENGVNSGSSNIDVEDLVIIHSNTLDELKGDSAKAIIDEVNVEDGSLMILSQTDYFKKPEPVQTVEAVEEIEEETENIVDEVKEVPEPTEVEPENFQQRAKVYFLRFKGWLIPFISKVKVKTVDLYNNIKTKINSRRPAPNLNQDMQNSSYKPGEQGVVLKYINNRYGRNPKFKKFMARLSQSKISAPSLKGFKVNGYQEALLQKRRFAIVGIAIIVIIIAFMLINSIQKYRLNQDISEQYAAMETEAQKFLSEAELKLKSDVSAAEIALFNAQKAISNFPVGYEDLSEEDKKKFNDLKAKLLVVDDSLNNTIGLSESSGNIEVFMDGRIDFGQDTNPTDLTIMQNTFLEEHLYVTDRGRRSAYKISTQTKTNTPFPGSENLESPQFIDVGVLGIYIYDSTKGVVMAPYGENDTTLQPIVELNGLSAEAFESNKITDLALFTENDNVYLLSQDQAAMYRAQRVDNGSYGLPSIYVTEPQLAQAQDVMGDFSIYILTGGSSGLNRYTFDFSLGKLMPDPVAVGGLKTDFQNLTAGFTGPQLDNKMYLFDADQKRILVFEKPDPNINLHPGEMLYLKQYVYRGSKENVFNDVKDIVVDQAEQFMYVLDGNNIWKIRL